VGGVKDTKSGRRPRPVFHRESNPSASGEFDHSSLGKSPQARKEHQDLFGEVIKPGEHYFKYRRGPAFADVIKLSASSVEKLCFALFESAVFLQPMADRVLEQRQTRMFDVACKLSIFGKSKR
jgi:hypothetical protein